MILVDRLESALARQTEARWCWFVLLAVIFAIQISPRWILTPDSVAYLSIARSLATRHALLMYGYAHSAYPPGYPLLISPAFWFPAPLVAVAIIQWLMIICLLWGLYRWMTLQVEAQAAALLTLLVMANVSLWIYYRRTLSELAFFTVAIWAVVMLNRTLDAATILRRFSSLAAGVILLTLLTLIREAGMLFAVGFVITILLRAWRGTFSLTVAAVTGVAVLVPAAAAAVAFIVYTERSFATTHMFGTHLSALIDSHETITHRIIDGLRLQICGVGRLIVPGMFSAYGPGWLNINTFVYALVCIPLAIGWYRWVRQRPDPYALAVPFYLLLYVLWDLNADTRYVLPMLPAVVVALWFTVEPLRHRVAIIGSLAALHLLVAIIYWGGVELPQARQCARERDHVEQLVTMASVHNGTIVAASEVPQCARLYLALLLDRPIIRTRHDPVLLDKPALILATGAELPVPGFRSASVAGPYVLLAADPPAATR
jgi:hypothetical protein